MTIKELLEKPLLDRIILLAIEHDIASSLLFNTDDAGNVSVGANCSDCFWWGTADAEDITSENFHIWKQTLEECAALPEQSMEYPINYADELFCARIRKMRPQGASYHLYPPVMWPLFDACGPERRVEFGNPKPQPTIETRKKEYNRRASYAALARSHDELLEALKEFRDMTRQALADRHKRPVEEVETIPGSFMERAESVIARAEEIMKGDS